MVNMSIIKVKNSSLKEHNLLDIEIFCNIMHVFIITFDQYNVSFQHYFLSKK